MERKSINTERGTFSLLHWHSQTPHAPKLLFTHGTGFNSLTYRTALSSLCPMFEIYAIDLRGHGFTTATANPEALSGLDIYEQDLLSVIKHLRSPLVLSGHSLGSMLSLAIAAKHPHLVSKLLLIEPIIMTPFQSKIWALVKYFGLGPLLPIASQAKKRRYLWESKDQIFRSYLGKGAFTTWPEHILKDYITGGTHGSDSEGVKLSCHPDWEAASFASTAHQAWFWMEKLRCKTRLLYASKSNTISEKVVSLIRLRYPKIETIKYQASHFLPMEQDDCLLKELSQF